MGEPSLTRVTQSSTMTIIHSFYPKVSQINMQVSPSSYFSNPRVRSALQGVHSLCPCTSLGHRINNCPPHRQDLRISYCLQRARAEAVAADGVAVRVDVNVDAVAGHVALGALRLERALEHRLQSG